LRACGSHGVFAVPRFWGPRLLTHGTPGGQAKEVAGNLRQGIKDKLDDLDRDKDQGD
jgi:hypothetical protein